jgi:F-type H+-transporting ATPase subunit a
MSHNPLEQFLISPIVQFSPFGVNLAFTNASLFMVISTSLCVTYLWFAVRSPQLIPSKLQVSVELVHKMVLNMLGSTIGEEQGKKFVPLIFSIFLFVLFSNFCGMLPKSFATTSQIIITFALSSIVFLVITLVGIFTHGVRFFKLFLPSGCPVWLAPLMIVIELFSFLAKPISLSLRLAANITSGHILLHVIGSAIVAMTLLFKFVPFSLVIVLVGFEFFVAILQAYIFAILSCVYLADVVNLH